MYITRTTKFLTDGSRVHQCRIIQGTNTIDVDCIDEKKANQFQIEYRNMIEQYTVEHIEII